MTEWWSKVLPYSSLNDEARPPRPWHFSGGVSFNAHVARSMLWTSDWGTSSPLSQTK